MDGPESGTGPNGPARQGPSKGGAVVRAPWDTRRVGDTLTYGIELAVGVGCLLGGFALRGSRLRWLAVVSIVAGGLAIAHALVRLLDR